MAGDLWGSIIGSAGSIVGDVANLFGQNAANRQAQQFATNTMNTQRAWALQDQASQNLYNSPAQQMARLKAAGLNPNLVYGQGVQGATGMQSGQPRGVSSPSYNPQSITTSLKNLPGDVLSTLQEAADLKKTKLSTESLGVTIEQQRKDLLLKDQEIILRSMIPGVKEATKYGGEENLYELEGEKYNNAQDYMRALNLKKEQQGVETQAATTSTAKSQSQITATNAALQAASYQSNLTAALQAGKQAILNVAISDAQRKNIEAQFANINADTAFKNAETSLHQWNWDPKNPAVQQFLQGIFKALLLIK